MHTYRRLLAVVTLISSSLTVSLTYAAVRCENPAAGIVSIQGAIEWKTDDAAHWLPVETNTVFCWGDTLTVRANSRAVVRLYEEQTNVQLSQGSTLVFTAPALGFSLLELLKGAGHFISRTSHALKVKTPFVNASVEGTEFLIKVDEAQTLIAVSEGRVNASNEAGQLALRGGQSALAAAGAAPVFHTLVDPLEAVQWTLYYPPVFDFKPEDFAVLPEAARSAVAASVKANRLGDLNTALALLQQDHSAMNDARFSLYRATLLLNVGRVEEAQQDIERALAVQPEQSEAWALRAVIAVTQNRNEPALSFATKAVSLAPNSAAARLALSYAYQARFNLDAALVAMQEAARHEPGNALAWSRLAEVWLMYGKLDEALRAAQTATQLQPASPQAKTVLGFAHLLQGKPAAARSAFEDAIDLDQAAPLPHLGLGLAQIRQGHLETGRTQIEIATSLEPRNSLLRSYVGKAYYEEKRDKLAGEQFALAKELDPKDPTPWFYDAIFKQSTNRPVEALQDLQKSLELNENRAVYRSRLLLDSDSAARSASQARIYSDLGFQQLALRAAGHSLDSDPANSSSHRFLADSYAAQAGQEIARVSELLQTQLLQPANTLPIQPQLAESTLEGGPARVSFNEFNPLFTGNGTRVLIDAVAGSNATWGEDVVVSGLHNRYSYSLGQYHYETDGFRANNDIKDNIYNLYAQAAVTPTLNIQGELREREVSSGDVNLNFDPSDFSITDRRKLEQGSMRFGVHYVPAPNSDVLLSLIKSERDSSVTFAYPDVDIAETTNEDGLQSEVRYLWRIQAFNLTAGVGMYKIDVNQKTMVDWTKSESVPCPPTRPFPPESCVLYAPQLSRKHHNAYVYANAIYPKQVIWTTGLGYEVFKQDAIDIKRANPKFGVQWMLRPGLHLRTAYFKTLKRAVINEQTIEPTHIAGFNQFFDDHNGTKATRYGLGLDMAFTPTVHGGIEVSRRNIDMPVFSPGSAGAVFLDRKENATRAYLYWTPSAHWAASAELQADKLEQQDDLVITKFNPTKVPLTLRYFASQGGFVYLTSTYVTQQITPGPDSILPTVKDEHFIVVDAAIGYRLPSRRGVFSLEIGNLLDKEFSYQDTNFLRSQPAPSRFIPKRTVLGKFTLSF